MFTKRHLLLTALVVVLAAGLTHVPARGATTCPAAGANLYVDNRPRVSGLSGPRTGAASPNGCAFLTITAALDKAAATPATPRNLILRNGTSTKPLLLAAERFPIVVPSNVVITNSDDPALGGTGLVPARYKIVLNKRGEESAIWLAGGQVRGLTVTNKSPTPVEAMVLCRRGAPKLSHVVLDGTPTAAGRIATGLAVDGSCAIETETLLVRGFLEDGVVVDTSGLVSMHNLESANNGRDGLLISEASSAADGPVCTQAAGLENPQFCAPVWFGADRPTLRSLGKIHHNARNGVTVGDSAGQPIRLGLGDFDVFENGSDGISIRPLVAGLVRVDLLDNDVFTNPGHGLYIAPAEVHFGQNKVHNNALNQIVFDGGGVGYAFSMDSPTHAADAGANAVYCYTAKGVFGIFAQNNSNVTVRNTQFEGGGTGLKDFSAQSGSTISVDDNATAITVCP